MKKWTFGDCNYDFPNSFFEWVSFASSWDELEEGFGETELVVMQVFMCVLIVN